MRKKTIEDYVEIIYDLEKKGKTVHTNDVARAFDVNPASVTEVFQKLSNEGYINYEKYSGASLTDKGRKIAVATKKRHDKLIEFLLILGVERKIAELDACEMEHILHPVTMKKIVEFVNNK